MQPQEKATGPAAESSQDSGSAGGRATSVRDFVDEPCMGQGPGQRSLPCLCRVPVTRAAVAYVLGAGPALANVHRTVVAEPSTPHSALPRTGAQRRQAALP